MKGMYWVWLWALLLSLGIVGMINFASRPEREEMPVFATDGYTEEPGQLG